MIKSTYYMIVNVETEYEPDPDRNSRQQQILVATANLAHHLVGPKAKILGWPELVIVGVEDGEESLGTTSDES